MLRRHAKPAARMEAHSESKDHRGASSTPIQLIQNRESQIRQYGLAEHARNLGFSDVETIDADLGRSGSGLEERPGFQRLVAEVYSGQVGAILCIEASRLARNGRDWHQLFELCGLAGALVIEPDGVYDPRLINDRLLLGLKGIMNEFDLTLMRRRSLAAIWQRRAAENISAAFPSAFAGPRMDAWNWIQTRSRRRVLNRAENDVIGLDCSEP
jgi:DNA invertase Pin-like site-specific DNA recombinase